jgi:hypothetical protein
MMLMLLEEREWEREKYEKTGVCRIEKGKGKKKRSRKHEKAVGWDCDSRAEHKLCDCDLTGMSRLGFGRPGWGMAGWLA